MPWKNGIEHWLDELHGLRDQLNLQFCGWLREVTCKHGYCLLTLFEPLLWRLDMLAYVKSREDTFESVNRVIADKFMQGR